MQILQILLALAPKILEVAQRGQEAWEAFMEAQKVEGDAEVNAGLDANQDHKITKAEAAAKVAAMLAEGLRPENIA